MQNQVDPTLCILINAAITQKSIGRVKLDNRHTHWDNYKDLINQQAILVWKQILYGRFSFVWEVLQHRYKDEMALEVNRFNPWIGQITAAIWRGL
eukprot:15011619-Ditylum_brightwellii.AAC.2